MSEHKQFSEQLNTEVPYGSIERALAGQSGFSVSAVIGEAWKRVKGNKSTIWLAIVLYMVAYGVVSIVLSQLLKLIGLSTPEKPELSAFYMFTTFLSIMLTSFLAGAVGAGISMLCIKIASDQPREATDIFNYLRLFVKLGFAYVAMTFLVVLGFVLFILPGIYLSIAYYFTLPLIVEKNMGIWEALEVSRKAVTRVWFEMFGVMLLLMILTFLAIIPLFIGIIWVLPLMLIAMGVAYRTLFGVEPTLDVQEI